MAQPELCSQGLGSYCFTEHNFSVPLILLLTVRIRLLPGVTVQTPLLTHWGGGVSRLSHASLWICQSACGKPGILSQRGWMLKQTQISCFSSLHSVDCDTSNMLNVLHEVCVSLEVQLYILTSATRRKAVVNAVKRMPSHLTSEQNALMWSSRSDRL